MKFTKEDIGKFFYIIDIDFDKKEPYREILNCKLMKFSSYESYELKNNKIEHKKETYAWLKYRENCYTPNRDCVYRTIEEAVEAFKKEKK